MNDDTEEGKINLRDSVIPPPARYLKARIVHGSLINERDYMDPGFLEHTRPLPPIARAARVGGGKYYFIHRLADN